MEFDRVRICRRYGDAGISCRMGADTDGGGPIYRKLRRANRKSGRVRMGQCARSPSKSTIQSIRAPAHRHFLSGASLRETRYMLRVM